MQPSFRRLHLRAHVFAEEQPGMSLEHRGDVGALVHVAEHLLELEDGLRRAHKIEVYDGGLALEHVRDVGVREERGEFARPRRRRRRARRIVGSAERDEPLDVQFANAMALGRVVPIAPETDHVNLPLLREAEHFELVVGVASLQRRGRASRRERLPENEARFSRTGVGRDERSIWGSLAPVAERRNTREATRRSSRGGESSRSGASSVLARRRRAPALNPEHVSFGKLRRYFFAREKTRFGDDERPIQPRRPSFGFSRLARMLLQNLRARAARSRARLRPPGRLVAPTSHVPSSWYVRAPLAGNAPRRVFCSARSSASSRSWDAPRTSPARRRRSTSR